MPHRFRVLVADLPERPGHYAFNRSSPMNRPHVTASVIALTLLLIGTLAAPATVLAQTNFPSGGSNVFPGTLFGNQPSPFPEDGRIKVLVLGLNPFGLTESASEQIGLIIQKNLNNTGHFAVLGPREMSSAFEREHQDLVDCREIACGVEAGKRLNADKVLVATIRLDAKEFVLNLRLINTFNNITDYQETVRFTDESMDEVLFRLVNNISRNSIRIGKVISTSVRAIVISLGARHGLQLGDRLVVYKQEASTNPLPAEAVPEQKKNIAIIKTININENTSEAILVYKLEDPTPAEFVKTYLEPSRQIELVEDTRREIDTNVRLANKILPLELAPVMLADSERRKWDQRLSSAQTRKAAWITTAVIGGLASIYTLNKFDNSTLGQIERYGAIGVTAYAAWQIVKTNEEINDIRVEGRSKGYVDLDIFPTLTPEGLQLALAYRF